MVGWGVVGDAVGSRASEGNGHLPPKEGQQSAK